MTFDIQRSPDPPYYVKALALGIPALMLGLQLSGWIGFVPVIRNGHVDFRNLYTAGYMVQSGHGHELYDYRAQKIFQDALVSREQIAIPFIRPAYQALLFAPLSFLPFRSAYFAFLIVNLAILALCFRLLRPYTGRLARVWRGLPPAMFVFIPIAAALMQGQDSIILLLLLTFALVSLDRGRDLTAGVAVALGLFKFQLVIPIALLFLAWRRWRFSAGFGLSALMLAALSGWIVGWAQFKAWAQSLTNISLSNYLSSGLPLPVNHMANLHGLVSGILGETVIAVPATLAISAIIFALAAIRQRHGVDGLLTAVTTSAVVSYYLFIHDLCVLLLPLVLTLDHFIESEAAQGNRVGSVRVRAAALLFAAPAVMSFAPDRFFLVALPLLAFALVTTLPAQGWNRAPIADSP